MFQKADIPQLSTKGWLKHRCVDFLTNISHFLPISNQPYSSLSPSSQLPDIPNMFSVAPSHTSVQPTRIHADTHIHTTLLVSKSPTLAQQTASQHSSVLLTKGLSCFFHWSCTDLTLPTISCSISSTIVTIQSYNETSQCSLTADSLFN